MRNTTSLDAWLVGWIISLTPPGSAVHPVTIVPPFRGVSAAAVLAGPGSFSSAGRQPDARRAARGRARKSLAARDMESGAILLDRRRKGKGDPGCYPWRGMQRVSSSPFSRRLLIASMVFGLFVLFDIALF